MPRNRLSERKQPVSQSPRKRRQQPADQELLQLLMGQSVQPGAQPPRAAVQSGAQSQGLPPAGKKVATTAADPGALPGALPGDSPAALRAGWEASLLDPGASARPGEFDPVDPGASSYDEPGLPVTLGPGGTGREAEWPLEGELDSRERFQIWRETMGSPAERRAARAARVGEINMPGTTEGVPMLSGGQQIALQQNGYVDIGGRRYIQYGPDVVYLGPTPGMD